MIRIAVVGLGWWGRQIVACLAGSARFKVAGGYDADAAAAAPFAAQHGISLSESFEALLARKDVDAVAIVTPHAMHEQQVIAALAAGKQVFCEKPLALTTESAERMLEACARRNGVLGIGHERRFEPAMEEMRRLATSGALGKLLLLDANVSHNIFRAIAPDNWRRQRADAPAGAMTALGIHLTDMFVSLAGSPRRVSARTATQVFTPPSEDFVSAEIDFSGGARGRVTCLSTPPYYGRFTLIGDRGWVEITEAANVDQGQPSTLTYCGADAMRSTTRFDAANTVLKNFEAWADAIEGRAPYRFTAAELIDNVKILEAVVRSAAADGRAIML